MPFSKDAMPGGGGGGGIQAVTKRGKDRAGTRSKTK